MKQWGRSAAVRLLSVMALCAPFAVVAFAQSDAADFDPKGLWDGRKLVPFKAMDDPKMVKASEADFLDDDDYILGVTVNGESRAYPTRFAWFHHIINDKAGKPETRYAVTYCSVCNTGIRFDSAVDGKPVMVDFFGLYNGVASFADRATESVLLQVSGQFVTGPLKGKSLKFAPMLDTTWKEWKTRHPDTLVMSPDTEYSKYYSPKGKPEKRGYDQFPMPAFSQSMTRQDKRLPRFEKVLAVALPAGSSGVGAAPTARAFPIAALRDAGGVVNDKVGDAPVTVFLDAKTTTAAAYSPVVDGKTLIFELRAADGKSAYYDRETGTRWNIDGIAEDGKLKGKTLASVPNHLSQWYGWVAYFPQTTIYGSAAAPQTERWAD